MIEQSAYVMDWRARVAGFAAAARDGGPLIDRPVRASVAFLRARPDAHYRTGRFAGLLREDAPTHPCSKAHGDIEKLLRAIFDALSGVVFVDDRLVAVVTASKNWVDRSESEGVAIEIEEL